MTEQTPQTEESEYRKQLIKEIMQQQMKEDPNREIFCVPPPGMESYWRTQQFLNEHDRMFHHIMCKDGKEPHYGCVLCHPIYRGTYIDLVDNDDTNTNTPSNNTK